MKNITANRTENISLKGDTFQIAALAQEASKRNPLTIDGTVGSFKYNDKKFKGYKIVEETLKTLKDTEMYSYEKTDGGKEFEKAVLNWVFNNNENIIKNMHPKVVSSPGGTGAISSTIYSTLDAGETILVPYLRWNPYIGLSTTKGVITKDYKYLENGIFAINDLKEKCNEVLKTQEKLVIILNDPCNNPTGYSLSIQELKNLVNLLNSFVDVPVNLVYDIAYFDYLDIPYEDIRKRFDVFTRLNENVSVSICFSASKTFCMYGLRVGAAIFLSKNEENTISLYNASNYYSRHTWSNCNKLGMSLVSKIVNNEESKQKLILEIEEVKNIIKDRYLIFEEEAKQIDLPIYSYSGGFFTAVKCDDPQVLMEKLFLDDIYLLNASPNTVRIGICSVPLEQVRGLANKIKKRM